MSGTKELRSKIRSTGATLKLTDAMGLVASSKIRRAYVYHEAARSYFNEIKAVFARICSERECKSSRYLNGNGDKCRIIVIAGDRGLAGGYNSSVFKLMHENETAEFIPIGKRVCERVGARAVPSEYFDIKAAEEMANECLREFECGRFDRLGIICTKFVSPMKSETMLEWVLPCSVEAEATAAPVIYEPDVMNVFKYVLEAYIASMIYSCVRESFLCEVYARRLAMDSAGKNAREMIDELKLEYNSARQSSITREINEIVSGSEA